MKELLESAIEAAGTDIRIYARIVLHFSYMLINLWENTGASRQIGNVIRRCCITDRLKNSVFERQQQQHATALPNVAGYRHLNKPQILIE